MWSFLCRVEVNASTLVETLYTSSCFPRQQHLSDGSSGCDNITRRQLCACPESCSGVGNVWYEVRFGQLCQQTQWVGFLSLKWCLPAAVAWESAFARACPWVCLCALSLCWSSCCCCGFDAQPLLTCRRTAGKGYRTQKRSFYPVTPFMALECLPGSPWENVLLQLGCCVQLQRLSLTMFNLCFTAAERKKQLGARGVTTLGSWLMGRTYRSLRVYKGANMAPRMFNKLIVLLWRVAVVFFGSAFQPFCLLCVSNSPPLSAVLFLSFMLQGWSANTRWQK